MVTLDLDFRSIFVPRRGRGGWAAASSRLLAGADGHAAHALGCGLLSKVERRTKGAQALAPVRVQAFGQGQNANRFKRHELIVGPERSRAPVTREIGLGQHELDALLLR